MCIFGRCERDQEGGRGTDWNSSSLTATSPCVFVIVGRIGGRGWNRRRIHNMMSVQMMTVRWKRAVSEHGSDGRIASRQLAVAVDHLGEVTDRRERSQEV